MKKVRTLILRTAGTNCDMETGHAFRMAGSEVTLLHVNSLIKNGSKLRGFDILAIPGGFTYGDDIASGKILANELKHNLKRDITAFKGSGKLVIGICNGFQVLVKMGLLPNTGGRPLDNVGATLCLNNSGKFEDRWVYLKRGAGSGNDRCVWTAGLPDIIYLPVAHAEGKFIPRDDGILRSMKKNGQIVFRYTDESGNPSGYPGNPNGSIEDIAGICDPTGRVFGLMPHPERHITFTQHPRWQLRGDENEMGIGLHIFKNGVNFIRNA